MHISYVVWWITISESILKNNSNEYPHDGFNRYDLHQIVLQTHDVGTHYNHSPDQVLRIKLYSSQVRTYNNK